MRRLNEGFTIIELTLAMTFVSILLISVAMLSIQLSNQYQRGVTLKEIAQSGTEAANDMKRTLSQEQIGVSGVRVVSVPTGGRVLCTGTYSYIANDPRNLAENNGGTDTADVITVGTGSNKIAARLMKVRDENGSYCDGRLNTQSERQIDQSDATELLAAGSRLLVVRGIDVTPNGKPVSGVFLDDFNQGRGIYTVTLTVGTGVNSEIDATSNCRPPSDTDANLNFCAIDTFTFTSRVGSSNRQ